MEKLNSLLNNPVATETHINETSEERKTRLVSNRQQTVKYFNETFKGNLNEQDGINCELCNNRGYSLIVSIVDGYPIEESVTCLCRPLRDTARKINSAGLNEALKHYTFDNYLEQLPHHKPIKNAAINYAIKPDGWFFISGQVGSGKTHVLMAILEFVIENRKKDNWQFFKWTVDNVKIKANILDGYEYDRLMDRYKTADILFIDDLFKGSVTEADIRLAYAILDYRYLANLPTVITSEHSAEWITENIDEAQGSRILEKAKNNLHYIAPDPNKDMRRFKK